MNFTGSAIFLVTIAVGYWVLILADKEGNKHAKLGKTIAWGIIIFSLLSLLLRIIPFHLLMGGHGRGHSWIDGPPGHSQGHGHQGDKDDKND